MAVAAADTPVHATWRATPVASIAERIADIAGMPVVIDRRIDPTKRIDLDGAGRPAEAVLEAVAEAAGGELAVLRHSFRISPTGRGRSVADADAARDSRLAPLPAAARKSLEAEEKTTWQAGTPPRELVASLAESASIPIGPLDAIPHDHLPAASLPILPLADRLDLVLAHYDLRIGPGPRGRRSLGIVPLDEPSDEVAAASRPRRPAGRRKNAATAEVPIDRYTLRAEAPLEELLQALAKRFGLTLELDAASLAAKGVAAREIVRVDLADAPQSEVLDAITKPRGLAWTIEGTTLGVR